MKSKIRIQRAAPTTGIRRMVTAAVRLAHRAFGGGSTPTARTPLSPELREIVKYLQSLPQASRSALRTGPLLPAEQLQPGLLSATGTTRPRTRTPNNTVFTIPPSSARSIGDELIAANISWKYYGDQWNNYAGVGPGTQVTSRPTNTNSTTDQQADSISSETQRL